MSAVARLGNCSLAGKVNFDHPAPLTTAELKPLASLHAQGLVNVCNGFGAPAPLGKLGPRRDPVARMPGASPKQLRGQISTVSKTTSVPA